MEQKDTQVKKSGQKQSRKQLTQSRRYLGKVLTLNFKLRNNLSKIQNATKTPEINFKLLGITQIDPNLTAQYQEELRKLDKLRMYYIQTSITDDIARHIKLFF